MKVCIMETEMKKNLKVKGVDFEFTDLVSIGSKDLITLVKNGKQTSDSFYKCWDTNNCNVCELNKKSNKYNTSLCNLLLEVQRVLRQ